MTERLPLNTAPLPLKLKVEDYLALDKAGAFAEYAKTELIEGVLFFMNAQHRPHGYVKMELYDRLRDGLRGLALRARLLVEVSIAIPPHSVPEPDIVLTTKPQGSGLIPLASVLLIVEVADTTLAYDLGAKAQLYARARVPEYWVADVSGRLIH
ncbi:MAG: Uma2 family endonuclease [Sphingomonadales bacterium]|nr:Uma2 family endonuclease [Sphingomonadales bacterium]